MRGDLPWRQAGNLVDDNKYVDDDEEEEDDGDDVVRGLSSLHKTRSAIATTGRPKQTRLGHELPPLRKLCLPAESVAQVFFLRTYAFAGAETLYAVQARASTNDNSSSSFPSPAATAAAAAAGVKMQGVLAVGMAGLAIAEGDGDVMALARRRYGGTLRRIGEVIGKHGDGGGRGEETVAAVVLMGMFEVSSCLVVKRGLNIKMMWMRGVEVWFADDVGF
jgi:hypothetical protein